MCHSIQIFAQLALHFQKPTLDAHNENKYKYAYTCKFKIVFM